MGRYRGEYKIRPDKRLGLLTVSSLGIWILALLCLISSGVLYRQAKGLLRSVSASPTNLPASFNEFPNEVGDWVGTELPIPATTRDYMEQNFADDYISRRYVNSKTNAWADVYVVYCSTRPGGILGHRPGVCYPASGWIWDGTEQSSFVTNSGNTIPCLIHRFHRPEPQYQDTVVLNFYVLNGQITTRESDFSGLFDRVPNITGNPARYVAQVQISSVIEHSVRENAKSIVDQMLTFLPDTRDASE